MHDRRRTYPNSLASPGTFGAHKSTACTEYILRLGRAIVGSLTPSGNLRPCSFPPRLLFQTLFLAPSGGTTRWLQIGTLLHGQGHPGDLLVRMPERDARAEGSCLILSSRAGQLILLHSYFRFERVGTRYLLGGVTPVQSSQALPPPAVWCPHPHPHAFYR